MDTKKASARTAATLAALMLLLAGAALAQDSPATPSSNVVSGERVVANEPRDAVQSAPPWGNCSSDCLDEGPSLENKEGSLVLGTQLRSLDTHLQVYSLAGPNLLCESFDSDAELCGMWAGLHTNNIGPGDDGWSEAWLAFNGQGIEAYGEAGGGYFRNGQGDYCYAAYRYPPYGQPYQGGFGILGNGTSAGGYFRSTDLKGRAFVGAASGIGVQGLGDFNGVEGKGKNAGGYFLDTNSSGRALVGFDKYKILGTGAVSFVQNHPLDKEKVIVYAAPEGDEVATYTRGSARLVRGIAEVTLSETFALVTNPDLGLTAHLTPRGDCRGLYVESLTPQSMIVRELGGGKGDVAFDYIVYGLRIGFEEASVVQEKEFEAPIPSMATDRERFAKYPELQRFTAAERFRRMQLSAGRLVVEPSDAGRILREAIHEYDAAKDAPVDVAPAEPSPAQPTKN
jgi:hypothetical protein